MTRNGTRCATPWHGAAARSRKWRRVATRYALYALRCLGFLYLAAAWIWAESPPQHYRARFGNAGAGSWTSAPATAWASGSPPFFPLTRSRAFGRGIEAAVRPPPSRVGPGNALNGAIPPKLGNLTQLLWLDLQDNQLSGSIPAALGNLRLNNLKGYILPTIS